MKLSMQGEAAEQVVDLATRTTVKGVEVVANLAGKGAVSLATFLLAAMKDQKRTKGKARIGAFRGQPTKVFVMRREDFAQFTKEAKKYGVLYAAVLNKKEARGVVDVVVNANDAARVARISERFALSAEEMTRMQESIHEEQRSANAPVSQEATQREQSIEEPGNPMRARTESRHPFAPSSAISGDIEAVNSIEERPSVRAQIKELREARKAREEQEPKRARAKTMEHHQPERVRKQPIKMKER